MAMCYAMVGMTCMSMMSLQPMAYHGVHHTMTHCTYRTMLCWHSLAYSNSVVWCAMHVTHVSCCCLLSSNTLSICPPGFGCEKSLKALSFSRNFCCFGLKRCPFASSSASSGRGEGGRTERGGKACARRRRCPKNDWGDRDVSGGKHLSLHNPCTTTPFVQWISSSSPYPLGHTVSFTTTPFVEKGKFPILPVSYLRINNRSLSASHPL